MQRDKEFCWGREVDTMSKIEIKIKPNVLQWLVKLIDVEALNQSLQELLKKWIHGQKVPTLNQIEKVSKATGIPFGYFFLQEPLQEDLSLLEYRTVNSREVIQASRNLINTIQYAEAVQGWMHDFFKNQETEKLGFIGKYKSLHDKEQFAAAASALLDLDRDWIEKEKDERKIFNYYRDKISRLGIIVLTSGIVGNNTKKVLDVDEFRAFSLIDPLAPLIFINANDSYHGRIFSLVHEFIHILLGENSLFNDYQKGKTQHKKEQVCNAVAAEILVPLYQLKKLWNSQLDSDTLLETLATTFHVSKIVIARRALDAGYITKAKYQSIAVLVSHQWKEKSKEIKKHSGGSYYRTIFNRIDHRFLACLSESVKNGSTQYTEAFRLTHTNRKTFQALLDKMGGQTA